jgi:hypothetical protein
MLLFFLYPRKDALYACSYYECMSMVTVVKWVASVPDIGPCWFSDIHSCRDAVVIKCEIFLLVELQLIALIYFDVADLLLESIKEQTY